MPYTGILRDLYPTIRKLLMGRTVSDDALAEWIRKGCLELSENYKFPGLQKTGPIVQFTPFISKYNPHIFMDPADSQLEIHKINSFFVYLQSPTLGTSTSASGHNLVFRTIDSLEVLINVPSLPLYWTRHEGYIWVAGTPDTAYYTYARYQKEHPFPNQGIPSTATPNAGDDLILLPRSWEDILEYQSAMRAAQELNLSTKVTELHTRLYGDKQFQQSGGLEGSPGLIFMRTSQESRDQTTSRKSFRIKMGSV